MIPDFITKTQAVAIDLGNTTTKVKTVFNEFEAASQYVDITDSVSERVPYSQVMDDLVEFQLTNHPERKMIWGTGISSIRDTTGLTETRDNSKRYLNEPFRNLMEMIFGYIAVKEEALIKTNLPNNTITLDLAIGLPTDDYDAKRYLENSDGSFYDAKNDKQLTGDNYIAFLKGQHIVKANGKVYHINISNVNVLDQPLGTLIYQAFDQWGKIRKIKNEVGDLVPNDYMRSHVTAIDYGGLTILTSQYELGYRSGKSDQIDEGAYKLAQNVATRWNKSEKADSKMKITIDHVLIMLRHHDFESNKYIVYYNRNAGFDVSDIVQDEINKSTQLIITRLKNLAGWDKSDYLFTTGGGANLINYDMLNTFLNAYYLKALKIPDSTFANVRGFFILCLKNSPEAFQTYVDYNYKK